jgi:hypothetical protein
LAQPAVAQAPAPQNVRVLDEDCVAARFAACTPLVDVTQKGGTTPDFYTGGGGPCPSGAWPPHLRRHYRVSGCTYVGLVPKDGKCPADTHVLVTVPRTNAKVCSLKLERGWAVPNTYAECDAWARTGPGRDACLRDSPTRQGFLAEFADLAQDTLQTTLHAVCKATNQTSCPEPAKRVK